MQGFPSSAPSRHIPSVVARAAFAPVVLFATLPTMLSSIAILGAVSSPNARAAALTFAPGLR